jgi:hypothetical protein
MYAKSMLGPTPVCLPLMFILVFSILSAISGHSAYKLYKRNVTKWPLHMTTALIFGGLVPFNIWVINGVLYSS